MGLICLFPGQGSQRAGMGATLFRRHEALVRQVDDILGYSLETLCLENPGNQLDQTAYTQPAVFVVNALSYLERVAHGAQPVAAAGHSLGEYNALFAAGVFDLLTGVRLVQRRGELMGRADGGGMIAVVGLSEDQVTRSLREHELAHIDIANLNSPLQVVLSGLLEDLERARAVLYAAGARHIITLRVSAAFHSRYMADAEREFASFLHGFDLRPPAFPVISNVHARPYQPAQLHPTLSAHISHPVRWTETIRRLMSLEDPVFEEIGIGNVLTGLVRRIRAETKPLPSLCSQRELSA